MIEIVITPRLEEWAKAKTANAKKTQGFIDDIDYHGSVYIGYLGEGAWWIHNKKAIHVDATHYDFILTESDEYSYLFGKSIREKDLPSGIFEVGACVDVKGYWTKVIPQPESEFFTVYIPLKNMNRGRGSYSFAAVLEEDKVCYLVGEIECDKFKKIAWRNKKGDQKRGRSGRYACNCLETPMNTLTTLY